MFPRALDDIVQLKLKILKIHDDVAEIKSEMDSCRTPSLQP